MNFKQFISSVSALAVAASAFAGMAVIASAESESETATRVHMRSWSADNKQGTQDVSDSKLHGGVGPSNKSSNYPGIGAVRYSFKNEKNLDVSKATYSFKASVSGSNRTFDVYTAANPTVDFSSVPLLSTGEGTNDGIFSQTQLGTKWDYSNVLGELTSVNHEGALTGSKVYTVDVTAYITSCMESKYATFVFSNANAGVDITEDTLTIEYAEAGSHEVPVTIKYVYGDSNADIQNLPEDFVTSAMAYTGTSYTADYEQTFDVVEGDTTYRYTYAGLPGDDTIQVKDSDNVITLKYTQKVLPKHNVKVNLVDSANQSVLKTIVDQSITEEASIYYAYPKYLTDEDRNVTHSCDVDTYEGTIVSSSIDSENTKTVSYTAYTGKPAYFVEVEDIVKTPADGGSKTSGKKGGRIDEATVVFTAKEAGKYSIETYAYSRNTHYDDTKVSVYKNSDTTPAINEEVSVNNSSYNSPVLISIQDVELDVDDTIIIKGTGTNGSYACADYVLVTQTEKTDIKPTTHDEGFQFQTSIDDAKANFTTLVINGIESSMSKSDEVDIKEKLNSLSGGGDVLFSVLLKGLPENVEITSITLK